MKIIETERCYLRPFELSDIDDFAQICADIEVMRYIGTGPHDKATTLTKIKQWIVNYRIDGFGLMALVFTDNNL